MNFLQRSIPPLVAIVSLTSCASYEIETDYSELDPYPFATGTGFEAADSPCFRPEVDPPDGRPAEGRAPDGKAYVREDAEQILQRTGRVEINLPEFLDPAGESINVAAVNINTGLTTVYGLETIDGQREVTVLFEAYGILGDTFDSGPANGAPWSESQDYCYDREHKLVFDAWGVPRRNYTPTLIAKITTTFDSPNFVWIPPEDRLPGDNGATDFVVSRWLEDEGSEDLLAGGTSPSNDSQSESNSNFTFHEIPPSKFYRFEQDRSNLLRCANALLPGGSATAIPPRDDCSLDYLASQHWPNWSGGCINLDPEDHWPLLRGLIRGQIPQNSASAPIAEAAGRPMYFILGYPDVDQRWYVKADGYRERMLNQFYPPWMD